MESREQVQRRTLRVVMFGQVLGGAGLAAGVTVGALLAEEILGSDGLAGLPAGLVTAGSALAAYSVGRISRRAGRRIGLGLGFLSGGIGAVGVLIAAALGSAPLLLASLFIYGAGTATNLQARYAGTDLATPDRRGAAVSVALVATTAGAVAGPNLVTPLGRLATHLGLPALAGPFLLAGAAYLAAGTALFLLLRPDPLLFARSLDGAAATPQAAATPASASADGAMPRPEAGAYVGATIMVLTQVTMVAIMTMTPVHMRAHHHGLGDVGMVISLHIAAMYLPSLLTGWLVDHIGRAAVAVASAGTLLAAGIVAAASPGGSLTWNAIALVLLGLGWNFGLISGTAMVVDGTVPQNRAQTQGTFDVAVALAGATGGVASGAVVAMSSYATLSLGGGLLALCLIPVMYWARRRAAPL